ncbi:MAG TPA: acyl-CoA dehydrogenase family protein [Burkholderiales bacterium]|nr:acyl-CoA dehydrogenase family protein [Burkholderiales bacterium]
MYDLRLTAEQLEIRETVRDFALREVKPLALDPERLQRFERDFPPGVLAQASQMGLRTLGLAEELGGAGADNLTACIVAEELAAGEVGIAAILARTSTLARTLFEAATPAQRDRFLPAFLADDGFHLAWAARDDSDDVVANYHRAPTGTNEGGITARRQGGDWLLNGAQFVANAPIAKLIVVEAASADGVQTLLVPSATPGLAVREPKAFGTGPEGEGVRSWFHGSGGELTLRDCRVPADNALQNTKADDRRVPLDEALGLGIGRAAFDAAVEYAKLRVQGGRRLIEHQAIGNLLAEVAVNLEVARNMVWRAAWASDHPEAFADRSLDDLPLTAVAKAFTAEAVYQATLQSAEVFGAMGVMRDMPLQKYVQDARVLRYAQPSSLSAKLAIAERVAGFRRASGR